MTSTTSQAKVMSAEAMRARADQLNASVREDSRAIHERARGSTARL
jgi:hypothetical protein